MARSRRARKRRKSGYVYVLTNPGMPGLCKIGMTTRSVKVRARELGASTGVPYPFRIRVAVPVSDPGRVEKMIHRRLWRHRVNQNREFFRADPKAIKKRIVSAANRVDGDTPFRNVTKMAAPFIAIAAFATLALWGYFEGHLPDFERLFRSHF